MSKNPVKPYPGEYRKGNEKNAKGAGGAHKAPPVSGQMMLGTPHCLGSRAGTFKGSASDVRSEKGRFSGGTSRLAGADKAGGQRGAGHSKQPKGHASLSKGENFAKGGGKFGK